MPVLMRRAARLVNKGFMDIIADLTPSGVSEAQLLAGDAGEGSEAWASEGGESWAGGEEASGGGVESSDDSW